MTDDEQEAEQERIHAAWCRGQHAAWEGIFAQALRWMGDPTKDAHTWRLERAAIVTQLRILCEEHGDNDWPDELSLADVIEKHLGRHLEA